ncbi:ATP-binding protein [Oerskovia enterophila]|uniref:AAA-like domain protein n=1 Tax=Oerskovia enterophila TaxID=43678 RepID=A0ABX2Y8K6_9CELL|nr:ATP-binding protein [Oerskovia enterophila]OCI32825.1 AAA-like domain protein [Oerskovia enterophila]
MAKTDKSLGKGMLRPTEPAWPTTMRSRDVNGRCVGTDNTVWLYRAVPTMAIAEAKTTADMLSGAGTLLALANELAGITPARVGGRRTSKSAYRNVHILTVNTPVRYRPLPGGLENFLTTSYPATLQQRRVTLVGVQLIPSLVSSGASGVWGKAGSALNSVIDTFTSGVGTPIEDYDRDTEKISSLMQRAGLVTASDTEMRLANSWFTLGGAADVVQMHHASHSHVFSDDVAVRAADAAGAEDCDGWPFIPGEHAITFTSVAGFDFAGRTPDDPSVLWAEQLMFAGAQAISIRGKMEPAKVTGAELTSQRKKNTSDLQTRMEAGKMTRADHEERLAAIEEIEARYQSGGGYPTLTDASVLVALDGVVSDVESLTRHTVADLGVMLYRQQAAMTEMMLCSPVRSNPRVHDLPMDCVATAGLTSLSQVGDRDGALLGFTERDGQPAYVSPSAASGADAAPLLLVPGQTGSGKAVVLTTNIPVPTSARFPDGWATMGDLQVGDQVYGRDGQPCNVRFVSETNHTPELYRVTFGDGQEIYADFDHQWVVTDFNQRNRRSSPKAQAAVTNAERMHAVADQMDTYASTLDPSAQWTIGQIGAVMAERFSEGMYSTDAAAVAAGLRMMDVPHHSAIVPEERQWKANHIVKTDPVLVMPGRQALQLAADAWDDVSAKGGTNAARWGKTAKIRAAAARAIAAELTAEETFTSAELGRMVTERSGASKVDRMFASTAYRQAGFAPVPARRQVTAPRPAGQSFTAERLAEVYPAQIAVKALAERLRQRFHDVTLDPRESVMTTGEMLAAGISLSQGHSRFATSVPAAISGEQEHLPVPAYTFGAWLGDGSKHSGSIVSMDQDIIDEVKREGYTVTRVVDIDGLSDVYFFHDAQGAPLRRRITEAGFPPASKITREDPKLIPAVYQRADYDQRLALLQGLMDTDGTISELGTCELSLSNRRLAGDALNLVRSMGIKASISWDQPAGYRDEDGLYIECKPRHRIHFTTDLPVFRMRRKAERLPAVGTLRETSKWNYVTDVTRVESVAARCIQVDSPDSTYLVEGFVPTHNTLVAQWLTQQWSRLGSPQVYIDPSPNSDLSGPVLAAGGQVFSLDSLAESDGVFDPLRFAVSPEVGIDMAASMLMAINPWGSRREDYETPLTAALAYGASLGAKTIGQALAWAKEHGHAPAEMVDRVFALINSSPMFRACVGFNPDSPGLRVADGITLIRVGDAHLDLPEPGAAAPTQQQRIALSLVRMMVYGSATAVAGRAGVVLLDEAWVFLGAGRSEVERLGRVARKQDVLVCLFTQRTSDALKAKLAGYISRGLILPMEDEDEARAALALFKIEATPERVGRITAKATMSATTTEHGTAPNWNSMRALIDPTTRQVLRGTVGLYCDLSGRAIPVEITLPPAFVRDASTNPEDVRRRLEAQARKAAAAAA